MMDKMKEYLLVVSKDMKMENMMVDQMVEKKV